MIAARQIFLGRGAGAKLPYDAEVEWLQPAAYSGSTYIDTGYALTTNVGAIKAKYSFTSSTTSDNPIWGANTSSDTNWMANQYNNKWWFGTTGNLFSGSQGDWMHEVEWNWSNGSVSGSVNGTTYSASYQGTLASGFAAYIFAVNSGGSPIRASSKGRIYFWRLWDDGVLVRDMIPVRFTNELGQSEGAMYDRVSGALFRKQGTGAFTYGNDK